MNVSHATRDLNSACYCGHAPDVLDALARGADPLKQGPSGKTALHFAAMGGHAELCSHLSQIFPESIHLRDHAGMTPLHLACRGGKTHAVLALHQAGADFNVRDDFGHTPSDWASETIRLRLDAETLVASPWMLQTLAQALSFTKYGHVP
jgi:ankyrin repeat protein